MPDLFACRKCGIRKPRTDEYFYKDTRSSMGLRTVCKPCYLIQVIKRRMKKYRKYLAYQKQYRGIKIGGEVAAEVAL